MDEHVLANSSFGIRLFDNTPNGFFALYTDIQDATQRPCPASEHRSSPHADDEIPCRSGFTLLHGTKIPMVTLLMVVFAHDTAVMGSSPTGQGPCVII